MYKNNINISYLKTLFLNFKPKVKNINMVQKPIQCIKKENNITNRPYGDYWGTISGNYTSDYDKK